MITLTVGAILLLTATFFLIAYTWTMASSLKSDTKLLHTAQKNKRVFESKVEGLADNALWHKAKVAVDTGVDTYGVEKVKDRDRTVGEQRDIYTKRLQDANFNVRHDEIWLVVFGLGLAVMIFLWYLLIGGIAGAIKSHNEKVAIQEAQAIITFLPYAKAFLPF